MPGGSSSRMSRGSPVAIARSRRSTSIGHHMRPNPPMEGGSGKGASGKTKRTSRGSFSIFDSGERWSRLARIVAASGSGSPKMGSHCKYCPAMVSCPAHRATLAAMLDVGVAVEQMTPELVGEAWTKLKAIESMAERVDFAIRERARREPIPLPNGKHLRLVESSRTSQDAKAMAERLRALGEDPEKFKKTTTYTQVREGTNK